MIQTDIANQIKEIYQKISQRMQTKIDQDGLTIGLLVLTMRINNNPDVNQKKLAEDMRITQGAMSSSVQRLIKLEMLEQIPLETDMRYNRLMVTEKGKLLIDKYRDCLVYTIKSVFSNFDEDELVQLNQLLFRVNNNLNNIDQQFEL